MTILDNIPEIVRATLSFTFLYFGVLIAVILAAEFLARLDRDMRDDDGGDDDAR